MLKTIVGLLLLLLLLTAGQANAAHRWQGVIVSRDTGKIVRLVVPDDDYELFATIHVDHRTERMFWVSTADLPDFGVAQAGFFIPRAQLIVDRILEAEKRD